MQNDDFWHAYHKNGSRKQRRDRIRAHVGRADRPDGRAISFDFMPEGGWKNLSGSLAEVRMDAAESEYVATHTVAFQLDETQYKAALDFCLTCSQQKAFGEYSALTPRMRRFCLGSRQTGRNFYRKWIRSIG